MTYLKWLKNCQPDSLYPVTLYFKDEGKTKAFIRQQKENCHSQICMREILKEVLEIEIEAYFMETQIYIMEWRQMDIGNK